MSEECWWSFFPRDALYPIFNLTDCIGSETRHPTSSRPHGNINIRPFPSICNSTIISSARQRADPCSCHERRAQKPRAEKQMRKKSGNIQHKAELWGRKVSVYGVMELSRQQYPRPLDPSPPPNASPQRSAGTEQQGCLMWLHNRGFHCRSVCGSDPCCIQPI